MLQHDFEQLSGVKITPEQYEVINGMYMCDDNQTKQEFCKSFMEMGLMAHVNYVVRLKGERETLNRSASADSLGSLVASEYAPAMISLRSCPEISLLVMHAIIPRLARPVYTGVASNLPSVVECRRTSTKGA